MLRQCFLPVNLPVWQNNGVDLTVPLYIWGNGGMETRWTHTQTMEASPVTFRPCSGNHCSLCFLTVLSHFADTYGPCFAPTAWHNKCLDYVNTSRILHQQPCLYIIQWIFVPVSWLQEWPVVNFITSISLLIPYPIDIITLMILKYSYEYFYIWRTLHVYQ